MTDQSETLDLHSRDIAADKQAALRAAFPEVFTEGGKIDFERLKLALGETVDTGKERYGMNWPGKADCFKIIQQPSLATLVPCPAESWPPLPFTHAKPRSREEEPENTVDATEESLRDFAASRETNTSENLIIEGDNLEVLKLLQKSYLGMVKMIYIDPPYNTGNDFIYPDNYAESLDTYLRYTGQVDSEGRKYSTNTEADGRFHSKWLNMMYPRLYLARNLLRQDGLLFVSVDDNEASSLRKVLDEIFGEENFVDTVIWKKRYGGGAKEKYLVTLHEYILVYARSKDEIENIYVPLSQSAIERYYKHRDEYFEQRGPFRTHPLESMKSFEERPNLRFSVVAPDGKEVWPKRQWRWSKERMSAECEAGHVHFSKDREGEWVLSSKQYLRDKDGQRETKFFSVIDDIYSQHGTNETIELFGDAQTFPFAKPTKLIEKLIQIGTVADQNEIVLDFFAGSGTTAHSIQNLNKKDNGNRRFILVQLPEPTGREDFPTIADITKERVRRVIKKLNEEEAGEDSHTKARRREDKQEKLALEPLRASASPRETKPDRGFKVFKLQSSNFKTWNADAPKEPAALARQLEMHVRHIVEGRAPEDILYEILLKSGFPPTTPIETLTLAGQTVFSIADGAMLICLEKALTPEVIKEMAVRKPERVVCLDEGFAGNDQLKTNAVQTMKTKGVTSFRTI